MPPSSVSAKLVVGIHGGNRFATHALRVTTQEPGGGESPLWETSIGRDGDEYAAFKVQQFDFTFTEPGTYWFNVYLDGRPAGRYPLTVEYMPMSNS